MLLEKISLSWKLQKCMNGAKYYVIHYKIAHCGVTSIRFLALDN